MVNSLVVLVSGIGYDSLADKYTASWVSYDNEARDGAGSTQFGIAESLTTVNLRIVADAKDDHNTRYGTSFGLLTPAQLFGGASV